jgi:hypothetical protein
MKVRISPYFQKDGVELDKHAGAWRARVHAPIYPYYDAREGPTPQDALDSLERSSFLDKRKIRRKNSGIATLGPTTLAAVENGGSLSFWRQYDGQWVVNSVLPNKSIGESPHCVAPTLQDALDKLEQLITSQ